jgi:hypothetical protein
MATEKVPRFEKPSTQMQKLDRLGWPAGISIDAYGLRIGVRTNCAEIIDQVVTCLPPGWEPSPSPVVDYLYSLKAGGATKNPGDRNFHLLFSGLTRVVRSQNLEVVLDELESALELHVAQLSPNRLFLHAGVVGWQGRAIVLPGQSWAGKSTLVEALLQAGATYYSDEFAVLDDQGHVYPFARRLKLRDWNPAQRTVRSRRLDAAELGWAVGEKPLPVGLVAFTRYRPEGQWQAHRLTPGQAALRLLDFALPVQREPDRVLNVLRKMLPGACILKGCRGEAEATARALLAAVEQAPPAPSGFSGAWAGTAPAKTHLLQEHLLNP